ncbi:MAG: putative non-heme bromoperoxidase BpoC [Syntrophorhabdus sp. PtaU1.Bin058]|nr:MAG: putative non-heme bromoperoxidase BpoC [Syntrophorhabdus sp. PtaU1.Bin058]
MRKYFLSSLSAIIICIPLFTAPVAWGAGSDAAQPAAGSLRQGTIQSVRAGDIDISYRIAGDGYPLILITGYSATMDMWDPLMIKELSSRFKLILFDNRGIGKTTASDKPFTIELFAEDTIGLMDALKIQKAHVLGWSMGTFIAEELALKYPERVNKLVLYAGNCAWKGKDVAEARPEVSDALFDLSVTDEERAKRLIGILFPKKWIEDHPDFLKQLPGPKEPVATASVEGQGRAIKAWPGTCGRVNKLIQPTLIITGIEDVIIPPANSFLMASKIPSSWLIRLPGGHSNMYQYPRTFSRCILAFLEAGVE